MIDRLREFIKMALVPKPVVSFRGREFYRCMTDNALIGDHKCPSLGGRAIPHRCVFEEHAGHKFRSPVILTLKERILIWAKII